MRIKYIPTDDIRSKDINEFIAKKYPQMLTETRPELILTSGGDGTLLKAILDHGHHEVPILGHASGTLNYLMNKVEDFGELISKLITKQIDLHTIYTRKIDVFYKNNNKEIFLGSVVNELILGDTIMGYHEFSISTEDQTFNDFDVKGTGLAVGTDIGSTGYSFNLGGPIIPLGANLWVINGIVCNRYLESDISAHKIEITLISKRASCGIYIDGKLSDVSLNSSDNIMLSTGNKVGISFLNKEEFLKKRIETAARYKK